MVGLQHNSDKNAVIRIKMQTVVIFLTVMGIFNSLKQENKYDITVKRGIYLRENSENIINFDISSTLFRMRFAILCSSICTKSTSMRPHTLG